MPCLPADAASPLQLVVLAGPNGVGKTTFAGHYAAEADFTIYTTPTPSSKKPKETGGEREDAKAYLTEICHRHIRKDLVGQIFQDPGHNF